MEEDIDLEVIKATQISLGKYIKRPPLTEKLLKKPPFRFLHDIITTVLKTTGFFEGLFDENELISDNVKDRDGKISFLNKAISIISLTTGKTLPVKASKIVAGQEPSRTNELLQCLASALDNNLSSHEAVKKYKSEKKQLENQSEVKSKDLNKSIKKGSDSTKSSSKSQNVSTLNEKKRKPNDQSITKKEKEKANDTTKKREIGPIKNESRHKTAQPKSISKKATNNPKLQSQSKTLLREDLTPRENGEGVNQSESANNDYINDVSRNANLGKGSENGEQVVSDEPTIKPPSPEIEFQPTQAESLTETDNKKSNPEYVKDMNSDTIKPVKQVINESIVHHTRKSSLDLEENLSQDTQSNYRQTKSHHNDSEGFAKQLPPPELENNVHLPVPIKQDSNNTRSASARPSSSRPGAPRPKEKLENLISDTGSQLLGKVNIIAEHDQNEEEDETSIIIVDQQENISTLSKEHPEELNLSTNEYGHLVQQILNSQKEFSQVTGKTEIEWQFGAQKAVEAQHQEIELLRYNIQALTRVTNPLGKLLDHIQEDVEVMRQELHQWSNIYDEITKEIHKESSLSEDSLLPLHSKLKQLQSDVQEKSEKINDLKVLIYKNSSRIEKLLSNGNVQ